jgi:hypothetical protein
MTQIEGIPSENVDDVLPVVGKALDLMAYRSGGRFETADLVNFIKARDMQLWLIFDGPAVRAVILTEIWNYPRRKALRLVGCVANGWKDLIHHRHDLWRWGQEQGCNLFEASAPRKWLRAMPEFREFHVLMECK